MWGFLQNLIQDQVIWQATQEPNATAVGAGGGNSESHLVLDPLMKRPLVAMSQDGITKGTEETSVQSQGVASYLSYPHLVSNSKSKQLLQKLGGGGGGGRNVPTIKNLTCLNCLTCYQP